MMYYLGQDRITPNTDPKHNVCITYTESNIDRFSTSPAHYSILRLCNTFWIDATRRQLSKLSLLPLNFTSPWHILNGSVDLAQRQGKGPRYDRGTDDQKRPESTSYGRYLLAKRPGSTARNLDNSLSWGGIDPIRDDTEDNTTTLQLNCNGHLGIK
jgi:hypothetical protein